MSEELDQAEKEAIIDLEQRAGCVNSEKLLYLADFICLTTATGKWKQSGPLAKPDDQAAEKIKAIANKFPEGNHTNFAALKMFCDYERRRIGIPPKQTIEEWYKKNNIKPVFA